MAQKKEYFALNSFRKLALMTKGPAMTQANALLRKNLTFQKRNCKTNTCLLIFPIIVILLIFSLDTVIKKELKKNPQDCSCVYKNQHPIKYKCNIRFTLDQMSNCILPSPPSWPPVLSIPYYYDYEEETNSTSESCRSTDSCPVKVLLTGDDQAFGERLGDNLFNSGFHSNSSDVLTNLSNLVLGSFEGADTTYFVDQAFAPYSTLFNIQNQCVPNSTFNVTNQIASYTIQQEVKCLTNLHPWYKTSSLIEDEIHKAFQDRKSLRVLNMIAAAYDFLNSDETKFNVRIWYPGDDDDGLVRAPRLVNTASNAYLQLLRGADVKMQFDFVKEMPRPAETVPDLDFFADFAPLFFTWVIMLLFPVMLISLVYEKQQKLRIMMKMHGLGDGPYWMITYAYFLLLSFVYILFLVVFGSIMGLEIFTMNSYTVQFVFYFIYINIQIGFAFLVATIFSKVKPATVIGYIYVFASGLLGSFLFRGYVERASFPRGRILLMEILPCFSLYRGLYEFGHHSFTADGMMWKDLSTNGIREVLIIMLVEWFIVLAVAYYIDQVVSLGSGVRKHPLFFLKNFQKKRSLSSRRPSLRRQGSGVSIAMEKLDVSLERKKVEQLLLEPSMNYAVVCDNLKKIYPGKDGNPEKVAVTGLSLALRRGECFGMLGPNGAGKTSSINMMIGLMTPTSGTAVVHGLDIRTDMNKIYTSMGVCPQHDLLWETLTGREHLLFYGRLKNLKGAALTQAVEESLKGVRLFHGGVGDKQTGKYSGGMKRRLSVAISLIGDPKVIYMDEPSSGLDPASRNLLWDAVKRAKKNCAIILTTHSMLEAEVLCDRLGIFVDGTLQCIGYPTELKARYGGSYVFTMTTSPSLEKEVENLVQRLSPHANKIYHISGTQKFELRKDEVRVADVLREVENAKSKFPVHAWGLADTTLEDVFIKVARGAEELNVLP